MVLNSSLIATVAIRVAPSLVNEIIDRLHDDPSSLRQCSLVSKVWRKRALKWLFAAIVVQITATDPWSYLRWFGKPMSGFHLAATHARELRLVQYPSFMWITPQKLSSIFPQLAAFRNVTFLSLHSLMVHDFDDVNARSVFEHFFPTVRKLDLDQPRATPRGLLRFLCNFCTLEDLDISDPEWNHEIGGSWAVEVGALPSLHGTLHLMRLHADSADFVSLLAGLPVAFRRLSLANCRLPSTPINLLLTRLSQSLESFSVSSWFNDDCFPDVNLSPCTQIEEIHFFVGMVPVVERSLEGIHDTLGTVLSHRVRTITLDLNTRDARGAFGKGYFRSFQKLDANLHRIASAYQGVGKTEVKLSADKPFALGSYLRHFRRRGKLVLGTRPGEPFGLGDVRWFE